MSVGDWVRANWLFIGKRDNNIGKALVNIAIVSSLYYTLIRLYFRQFSNWIYIKKKIIPFGTYTFSLSFPFYHTFPSFHVLHRFRLNTIFFLFCEWKINEIESTTDSQLNGYNCNFISWKYQRVIWNETAACQHVKHNTLPNWMCVNLWSIFKIAATKKLRFIHSFIIFIKSKPFIVGSQSSRSSSSSCGAALNSMSLKAKNGIESIYKFSHHCSYFANWLRVAL